VASRMLGLTALEYYAFPLAFILVISLFVIRALRWNRAERILFVPITIMVVLCIAIPWITTDMRASRLWANLLARNDASILMFLGNDRQVTVSDPDEIAAFFALLKEARHVGAHHSYPVTKLQVRVGEGAYRYSIGPDSDRADEFWITDLSCNNGETELAQIQSHGLTEYLRKLKVLKPRPKR